MWPGRARSSGRGDGSMRALMVASRMLARAMSVPFLQQSLYVFGDHVDFQVDGVSRFLASEAGDLGGVRDDGNGEAIVEQLNHGQAATVDGDRALLDDVAQQLLGRPDAQIGSRRHDLSDAVDVALDDVATEAVVDSHWAFQVDDVTRLQVPEVRALQRLVHRL